MSFWIWIRYSNAASHFVTSEKNLLTVDSGRRDEKSVRFDALTLARITNNMFEIQYHFTALDVGLGAP